MIPHVSAVFLERLRADCPDAAKVHTWLAKQKISGNLAHVEVELRIIASLAHDTPALSGWEKLPSRSRMRRASKIATAANELLSAIMAGPRPPIPDDILLLVSMPPRAAAAIAQAAEVALEVELSAKAGTRTTQDLLAAGYKVPSMTDVIQSIANSADALCAKRVRDARPCTGDPDARVFARELEDHFVDSFGRCSDEVLAACVSLRYPELKTPVTAEVIRIWRRKH